MARIRREMPFQRNLISTQPPMHVKKNVSKGQQLTCTNYSYRLSGYFHRSNCDVQLKLTVVYLPLSLQKSCLYRLKIVSCPISLEWQDNLYAQATSRSLRKFCNQSWSRISVHSIWDEQEIQTTGRIKTAHVSILTIFLHYLLLKDNYYACSHDNSCCASLKNQP